jgi:hypothetical protein
MSQAHRRHVILPEQTVKFLEQYQQQHGLTSFSATIEAASLALQQQELRRAYAQYAHDYANDPEAQAEAEAWLDLPMQETEKGGQ